VRLSYQYSDYIDGLKDAAPFIPGTFPWAVTVGITAVNVGISPPLAVAMSLIVFAGAAQLAAIQLIGSNASIAIILFTVLVINMRFVVYGISLSPYIKGFKGWKKLLVYGIVDQTYAASINRFENKSHPEDEEQYFLGTVTAIWATWIVGTAVGSILGSWIPEGLNLDFIIPLIFLSILFSSIINRVTVMSIIITGFVAVLTAPWPYDLGVPTAIFTGFITSMIARKWRNVNG
jgi:4-azaleucine resistance transporter AzlC